jgi:hypothetical protein
MEKRRDEVVPAGRKCPSKNREGWKEIITGEVPGFSGF